MYISKLRIIYVTTCTCNEVDMYCVGNMISSVGKQFIGIYAVTLGLSSCFRVICCMFCFASCLRYLYD